MASFLLRRIFHRIIGLFARYVGAAENKGRSRDWYVRAGHWPEAKTRHLVDGSAAENVFTRYLQPNARMFPIINSHDVVALLSSDAQHEFRVESVGVGVARRPPGQNAGWSKANYRYAGMIATISRVSGSTITTSSRTMK
jgi:hypothetical protein